MQNHRGHKNRGNQMNTPEIIKRTIANAIKLLDAAGCKYKIIEHIAK